MPLGDVDVASGVFFKDFGAPVVFNGATTFGNFDAPGKDAIFDHVNVLDTDFVLMIAVNAFNPAPTTGSRLTVNGIGYQVREPNPVDDGELLELKLRRL